jgi:hypothetical protein
MRIRSGLAAVALLLASGNLASANILYNLSGVTLSSSSTGVPPNEGTLTGTFTTNDARTTVLSFDISASAAGAFAGFEYTTVNSMVTASSLPSQFFQLDSTGNVNELRLFFATLLIFAEI